MNALFKKINFVKNVIGLGWVIFYCIYVVINLAMNKGNMYINIALLLSAFIYSGIYIFSSFIKENKKLKKDSKKSYKKTKKAIGCINAFMIITSVVVNDFNSFISVVVACITIGLYFIYIFFEFVIYLMSRKIKKIQKRMGLYYDNRS